MLPPLLVLQTAEIGMTENVGDTGLRFEIWFRRRRKPQDTYVLQASSAEVKTAWTHVLGQILWRQALRNRGGREDYAEQLCVEGSGPGAEVWGQGLEAKFRLGAWGQGLGSGVSGLDLGRRLGPVWARLPPQSPRAQVSLGGPLSQHHLCGNGWNPSISTQTRV